MIFPGSLVSTSHCHIFMYCVYPHCIYQVSALPSIYTTLLLRLQLCVHKPVFNWNHSVCSPFGTGNILMVGVVCVCVCVCVRGTDGSALTLPYLLFSRSEECSRRGERGTYLWAFHATVIPSNLIQASFFSLVCFSHIGACRLPKPCECECVYVCIRGEGKGGQWESDRVNEF